MKRLSRFLIAVFALILVAAGSVYADGGGTLPGGPGGGTGTSTTTSTTTK